MAVLIRGAWEIFWDVPDFYIVDSTGLLITIFRRTRPLWGRHQDWENRTTEAQKN